jgi:hypothetical protein
VAEDGVHQLELRDAPTSGEHSHEANEHEIDEGSQGASMLPTGVDQSGTEFWSPTRIVVAGAACDPRNGPC